MITWQDIIHLIQNRNPQPPRRVIKTDVEWRELLSPEQYNVARRKGTERAFSGEYCDAHTPGLYACVCCGTPLFDSSQKFQSGTGWPSFTEPVGRDVVRYEADRSYGMVRVEVLCNICDAHLGHVFPDGPEPSGLRYCINSISLQQIQEDRDRSGDEPMDSSKF